MNGYYINLKHREDRNNHIKNNILKYDFFNKLNRFNAVKHSKGYIGCGLSHLFIFNKLKKLNDKYYIIIEDDLEIFNQHKFKTFIKMFDKIKDNKSWDLITLTPYYFKKHNIQNKIMNKYGFERGYNIQTTSGYIIKKDFIKYLEKSFKISVVNLSKNKKYNIYSIDQYWKHLQLKHNFYRFKFNFAKQLINYSDIENKVVYYFL